MSFSRASTVLTYRSTLHCTRVHVPNTVNYLAIGSNLSFAFSCLYLVLGLLLHQSNNTNSHYPTPTACLVVVVTLHVGSEP
jgi:hypothetical protein